MSDTIPARVIPAPAVNPENADYFDAAARGTLLIGRCSDCGQHHFYPRALCPFCFSDRTERVSAAGTGTIYAFSTSLRGVSVPYTIAYVSLDEGVSMMSNLVDCDAGTLAVGQRVRVVFKQAEGGATVPMFTPAR